MTSVSTTYRVRQARPVRRTKLQETCCLLTEIAHELGPNAKLPTVLQLRDRLGVSVATLNSALSELEAQRLIRRKHGVGIYVAPRIRHRAVALVCNPSFFRVAGASPFWSLLVDHVRQRAAEEREAFAFHFSSETPEMMGSPADGDPALNGGLADDISAGRVDGVLSVGLLRPTVRWIERHVPLVSFAAPGSHIVTIDDTYCFREGVAALAALGCRRIALWSVVAPYRRVELPDPDSEAERLSGYTPPGEDSRGRRLFREALAHNGLPYLPELVKDNTHLLRGPGLYPTEPHHEQGLRTAMEVFGTGADPSLPYPDGILCTDDTMLQGALSVLTRLGVRVGRGKEADVRIATQANVGSPVLLGWEKEIILIEVDPAAIVQSMFDTLETLMDGREPASPIICIPPRIRNA